MKAAERDLGLEERREEEGGGGGEEERAEREDAVLSAKCSLNREERTMGAKIPLLCLFLHYRH